MPFVSPEKLTEAFTIKLGESQLKQLRGLADAEGVGLAEFVRNLVDREIEFRRRQFNVLESIFGIEVRETKE